MSTATPAVTIEIRPATAADASEITDIYNQGIRSRLATFETRERTIAEVEASLQASAGRFPWLVAVRDGRVLGWANASSYRSRECYAGIGEFSIYIHEEARGSGVGRVLLPTLIEAARAAGFWKLLSRIFPANVGSRRLCAACGFREVGTYEKHAQLEGVWMDTVIVENWIGMPDDAS